MVLYVARHGQTLWNVERRVCGASDVELTETGLAQARQMAEEAEGKAVGLILSSPLKRALVTAQIAADRLGLKVYVDPRLAEQNYGIFEGADRDDPAFLEAKRQFAARPPQGESILDVAARVYSLLDELAERRLSENALIVAHGGVCRLIHSYFISMTRDEFASYSPENCQLEPYCLSVRSGRPDGRTTRLGG